MEESVTPRGFVCLLLLLAGVVAFLWFPGQRPRAVKTAPVDRPPESRRYALDGTFYMMRYAAVRTARGVYGFEPGCEVHLVESLPERQAVLVSDGRQTIEVSAARLTRDLDVADALRWQDQADQTAIAEERERQQAAYEAAQRPIYIAHAQDVQAAEEARLRGTTIGLGSVLDLPPQPVGGLDYGYGSPVSSRVSPYGDASASDVDAVSTTLRQSPFSRLPSAAGNY